MKPKSRQDGLNAFDVLLLRNAARVRGLDSAITYLSPFLPGQSPSAALGSEAAAAATVLLNTYMDQLVSRLTPPREKGLDSKYLDAIYARSRRYRVLAYVLSIVKSSELLLEMATQHFSGRRGQWRAVLSIEGVKAALRLSMLGLSQRALPSNVPVHEPGLEAAEVDVLVGRLDGSVRVGATRSGKTLPPTLSADTRAVLRRPDLDMLRPPLELIHRVDRVRALAEVLHIIRPLIYALLAFRYRAKRRSWTPWVVGVGIDLAARQLARRASARALKAKPSGLEKQVLGDRDKDLAWWFMRGAMYETFSRPVLDRISEGMMKVPVVKIAGILVQDWMYLFDEYFFGAATM